MCGFTFIYNANISHEQLNTVSEQSQAALYHRGPDAGGLWIDAPVAISHRRLSIIDLQQSNQPMRDKNNRFVLAYNGEIYNYRELRQQLEPHWHFRTNGDTEVLLAGITHHGPDFCKKMEGMWAFVLWDQENQNLTLGRDRMGKKPLYFQTFPGGFACASELPALAPLTPRWEEDLDSTADYLRYGYYLPGTTTYQNVFEILPGHAATWSPGQDVRQQPYWTLKLARFQGNKKNAEEQLSDALIRSIKRRLVADVEVGAFLSGGIDSSLIVSIMTHDLGQRPKTFTIGFPEFSYDESSHAREIAHYFQTDHHEEILKAWEPNQLEILLQKNIGQPFADSSLLPTSIVAQLAAQHVKVALSGDGADEVFSGYQRYQARVLLMWYSRLPSLLRNSFEKVIHAFPEPMAHHSHSLLKKAHLFCKTAINAQQKSPYIAPLWYTQKELAQLAPALAERGHTAPTIPQETNLDDVQKMMAMDALVYLPQDILTKVDRATMAFGLESRAPFLDTDLLEIAFSLPRHWHRHGLSGKRMLRDAFADKLPSQTWKRRKQGFAVPVSYWFQNELGDTLRNLLHSETSPINPTIVHDMLVAHRNGNKDYSFQLWAIYVYLNWRKSKLIG